MRCAANVWSWSDAGIALTAVDLDTAAERARYHIRHLTKLSLWSGSSEDPGGAAAARSCDLQDL